LTPWRGTSSLGPMTVPESAAGAAARSRNFIWWGAALGSLILGYADLWRGGETLAPLLLVVGYLVLVPAAILKG
jgi:hypothetical protein